MKKLNVLIGRIIIQEKQKYYIKWKKKIFIINIIIGVNVIAVKSLNVYNVLKNGHTRSCGCLKNIDHSGEKIKCYDYQNTYVGEIEVLEKLESTKGGDYDKEKFEKWLMPKGINI